MLFAHQRTVNCRHLSPLPLPLQALAAQDNQNLQSRLSQMEARMADMAQALTMLAVEQRKATAAASRPASQHGKQQQPDKPKKSA